MKRQELIDRAWAYNENDRYEECIRDCNKLIDLGENVFFLRADCLRNIGLLDEAISDCNMAISLDSTNAWAYEIRFNCYVNKYTQESNRKTKKIFLEKALNDISNVISCVISSMKDNPCYYYYKRSDIYREMGFLEDNLKLKINFLEKALDDANKTISLKKDSALYFANRGIIHRLLGKIEKAADDFETADRLKPTSLIAYKKALCYGIIGDYNKAKKSLVQYFELANNGDPDWENANALNERFLGSTIDDQDYNNQEDEDNYQEIRVPANIDADFVDIILKLAQENGKDIFRNSKKLKSLLLDYTKNDYKHENSLLLAVLGADSVKYINKAENLNDCKQFLVKHLEDEQNLSPQKSAGMLDILFLVLRGEKPAPISENRSQAAKLKATLLDKARAFIDKSGVVRSRENLSPYNYDLSTLPHYDLSTLQLVRTLEGCGQDKKGRKTTKGRHKTVQGNHDIITSVAFSPDCKYIVSGSANYTPKLFTLKLWDIRSGRLIWTVKDRSSIEHVTFSPDNKYILSASFDGIYVWDTKSGRLMRIMDIPYNAVLPVAFSPDGKYIVSGSGYSILHTLNELFMESEVDYTLLLLWDTKNGKLIRTMEGHEEGVRAVAFSRDSEYIVSGSSDGTLKLRATKNGKPIWTVKGHEEEKDLFVAFSPAGEYIVSGSDDNTLKLWDAKNGRLIWTVKVDGVTSVAFSPAGEYIVSGAGDGTLKLWDTKNGRHSHTIKDAVSPVAFSPDGKYIVSGSSDNTLKLWGFE